MKKTLVLLLILAVAGGVFAQDGFGGKGEVRMGTDINFLSDSTTDRNGDATMTPSEDHSYGQYALTFDKGAFHSEMTFKGDYSGDSGGSKIAFMGEYGDGVNDTTADFKVHSEIDVLNSGTTPNTNAEATSLYAYHYFLDRQLKIDWAYAGYETIYWRVSDIVASDWDNLDGNGGVEVSFMPTSVEGLNVGIFLPGNNKTTGDGGFPDDSDGWLMSDFFKQTVIGGKYVAGALSASAMFKMAPNKHEAFNFGVKYQIDDAMSARVDAEFNEIGEFGDYGLIRFGANFEYAASPITGGLTAKVAGVPDAGFDLIGYAYAAALAQGYTGTQAQFEALYGETLSLGGLAMGEADRKDTIPTFFYINPYFYYDIIVDTLQFRLPITFAMGMSKAVEDLKFIIVEPKLYWNMAKDGVTDDPAYGMLFEYTYAYELDSSETTKSTLAAKFRWSF